MVRGEMRVGERSVGSVLADRLGRGRAFVVAAGAEQVVRALSRPPAGGGCAAVVCRVLGGEPLACLDVRAEAEATRREGAGLVADLTGVSPLGCAALRLGADALVAPLSVALEGHALVAVAPGAAVEAELLQALPDAREVDEALLAELLELDAAWGRASDCAQVLCAYLACHPAVAHVSYPGLKGDASFEVAARTLRGGFGPLVDVWLAAGCDLDEALLARAGVTARRLTSGEVRLHVGGGDAREVIGALECALAATDGDAGRRA